MATIKLEDAMKLASADEFWAIRGKAIQAYASLEQSAAGLFSVLAGTDAKAASIIFFRISSADSRNKIMEKLFQKKFGEQYNLFRNSLFKQLGTVDRERNEIVHWNVVNHVSADVDGNTASILMLVPPANWFPDSNSPKKSSVDMVAFSKKCVFYTRLINCFTFTTGNIGGVPQEALKEWEPMFNEPIAYPPPVGHLLHDQFEAEIGPHHFTLG